MAISDLLKEIDAEIAKLQQARALLSEGTTSVGRGRPKGSKNAVTKAPAKKRESVVGLLRRAASVSQRP